MVRCKDQKDIDDSFTFKKDFLLYEKCDDDNYCLAACSGAESATTCDSEYIVATGSISDILPVGDKYIISYNKEL